MALSRTQSAAGSEVTVLGLKTPEWPEHIETWQGASVKALHFIGPRRFGYAPEMVPTLNELNPDIVHLHGLWMHHGRSVLQWHLKTGRPYVISIHGMLSQSALTFGSIKKSIVSMLFQKSVFEKAAAVLVTSHAEARDIERYGVSTPVFVVPNGIKEIDVPDRSNDTSGTILYLGRIHKIKGIDQLILAWEALERDFPSWKLKIIGPDQDGEVARLRSLIQKIGLRRVTISDPVFGMAKAAVMSNADIFALPSRSENFAMTVAESLMLEVPVVSSQGAPWSGLETERCGLWVPYGAKSMEAGLRELMVMTRKERWEMGVRGRNWMIREFSWEQIAQRIQDVYLQAVRISR